MHTFVNLQCSFVFQVNIIVLQRRNEHFLIFPSEELFSNNNIFLKFWNIDLIFYHFTLYNIVIIMSTIYNHYIWVFTSLSFGIWLSVWHGTVQVNTVVDGVTGQTFDTRLRKIKLCEKGRNHSHNISKHNKVRYKLIFPKRCLKLKRMTIHPILLCLNVSLLINVRWIRNK